jgi:hypothetical protein
VRVVLPSPPMTMARWVRLAVWLALAAQLAAPTAGAAADSPQLLGFHVSHRRYVVEGKALGRVDIWVVPTGTRITRKDHEKLGLARQGPVAPDGTATWTLDVGDCPLATHLYACAYDAAGKRVPGTPDEINGGGITLDITGASAIFEQVCEGR